MANAAFLPSFAQIPSAFFVHPSRLHQLGDLVEVGLYAEKSSAA